MAEFTAFLIGCQCYIYCTNVLNSGGAFHTLEWFGTYIIGSVQVQLYEDHYFNYLWR